MAVNATYPSGLQVGINSDATKNFTLKQDGANKLLLKRGNDGAETSTILTVNADDSINGPFLGSGQTWQDVTASRASGVTYTNSTGKPITFSCSQNAGTSLTVIVGGVTVWSASTGASDTCHISFVVPTDFTYSYTGAIQNIRELR